MKHRIPFTQFLMPNGRQVETDTEVGDAEFEQWKKIREMGFRLTVELLSDWKTVSQCIEDREMGDFDCVLAPNGPEVPAKLSEMLLRFDPVQAKKFLRGRKRKPPLEPLTREPKEPAQVSPGYRIDDPTLPF